jgi:hypothetical protein
MSGVAPTSTTADLAKDVPLEKTGSSDLPGAFPETPATEPAAFSVNPIPATEGPGNPIHLAPGEKVPDPSTFTKNTITSTVEDGETAKGGEQTFGVAPLPATGGVGNPIHLAPGEKVPDPSTFTGNTIHSNVHLDGKGGVSDAPVLPPVVTPEAERAAKGTGILDLPPISNNLIPESSLPIGDSGAEAVTANPTIQSAGPSSTTAQLAAKVPLESEKVPDVVKESQKEAGVSPEASSDPVELEEKADVEKELLSKVKPAAVTSDDTHHEKPVATTVAETGAAVGAAALAVGGAALAYANGAKDKALAASGFGTPATNEAVPEVVKESIAESGQGPEAAAFSEPIAEKSAVEKELLAEIKPETSTGEPAPKIASEGLKAPETPKEPDSRDISPTTVPGTHKQTAPVVTSGIESAVVGKTSTPETAAEGSKPSPIAKTSAGDEAAKKHKKRNSFFGKLKAKFSDKDKPAK